MKFFVLDDDKNTIRILQKIIGDREMGTIVGTETDGERGLNKIRIATPDIVLIDLLMPGLDGLRITKQLKKEYPALEFIMISQVSSKEMVEKAYKYGVEYYIYKPINAVEVETIIQRVIERIEINRTMLKLKQIFEDNSKEEGVKAEGICEQCIRNILLELGIISEKGSEEMIKISKYLILNEINLNKITLKELYSNFIDNYKSMEQRIRRAIGLAMTNIANLGIEDYMNDIFVKYSNTLFNFQQIQREMDYVRGKIPRGGTINIKKFLIGLMTHCEHLDN